MPMMILPALKLPFVPGKTKMAPKERARNSFLVKNNKFPKFELDKFFPVGDLQAKLKRQRK